MAGRTIAQIRAFDDLSVAARKVLPETPQEARNVLSDVADLIKRIRILGASSAAELSLPAGVDEDLRTAQEAVFAAMRRLESDLQ